MDSWKCKYCERNIELKNGKYTQSNHLRNCKKFKEWKEKTLTKEFLEKEYLIDRKSAYEISNLLGLNSVSAINIKLKQFKISIRNISESKLEKRSQEKTKKTCLERYGDTNVLGGKSIKKQEIKERLLIEEGISNVFQRQEVKDKIIETCLKKYGVIHPMKCELIKNRCFNNVFNKYGVKHAFFLHHFVYISKAHLNIINLLKNFNIKFEIEKLLKFNNYRVDLFIEPNFIIEVYGDFWHGNPIKYSETDILSFSKTNKILVKEIWEKNKIRIDNIEKNGYITYIIWEYDIKNNIKLVEKNLIWKLKELNLL